MEFNWSIVCIECDACNFTALCRNVFLLKFASVMSFHKSCLADSSVSDQKDFEFGDWGGLGFEHSEKEFSDYKGKMVERLRRGNFRWVIILQ